MTVQNQLHSVLAQMNKTFLLWIPVIITEVSVVYKVLTLEILPHIGKIQLSYAIAQLSHGVSPIWSPWTTLLSSQSLQYIT